jgi:nicotinamide-nucleotide amidase
MPNQLRAEVVSIGDELTTGQRLDTNSQWISRELALLGIPVAFHTTVNDSREDGVDAFRIAAGRADIVVATGGLGPTADDLTRDVLAAVAAVPLELFPEALADVESRFARRGVAMPESNRLQAMFPRGSRVIPNPEGTAPGIDCDLFCGSDASGAGGPARSRCFALPGVPAEMHTMWRASVGPAIVTMLPGAGTIRFSRIKCFGAGESAIEAMLPDIVRRGRDPLVGITAHEATITLRIAARGADEAACQAASAPTEDLIRRCLGSLVFGTEDDELEDAALAIAQRAGATLATVEVGTQGRVANLLVEAAARAGNGVFVGGRVLHGAPAAGVVNLAAALRAETAATHALAIGPVDRDPGDGVDSVEIALAGPEGIERIRHRLGGAGGVRLARAAKAAIDLVRRSIGALPPAP